jgi:hypothetical protein
MEPEIPSANKACEANPNSLSVTEGASNAPVADVINPNPPPAAQQNVPPKLQNDPGTNAKPPPKEPLLIRIVADNVLTPFERKTVAFGKVGILVAFLSLLAASVAGYYILQQFKEMAAQTDLLSQAAGKARLDARATEIATAKQLGILQNQLAVAERQIRIDQRPWLKIIFLGDDPDHAKEAYNTTTQVVGGPLKIPLRIVNAGKTPAFHIIGDFVIELVPVGEEPNIPRRRDGRKLAAQRARTSIIYQGSGGFLDVPVKRIGNVGNGKLEEVPVSLEESHRIDSKTAYAVVWGRVRYSDAFGVSHWTKYCNAIMAGASYVDSNKCSNYGGMDNNTDPPRQQTAKNQEHGEKPN